MKKAIPFWLLRDEQRDELQKAFSGLIRGEGPRVVFTDEPYILYADPDPAIIMPVSPVRIEARGAIDSAEPGEPVFIPPDRWGLIRRKAVPFVAAVLLIGVCFGAWIHVEETKAEGARVTNEIIDSGYRSFQEIPTKHIDCIPEKMRYLLHRNPKEMNPVERSKYYHSLKMMICCLDTEGKYDIRLIRFLDEILWDKAVPDDVRKAAIISVMNIAEFHGVLNDMINEIPYREF